MPSAFHSSLPVELQNLAGLGNVADASVKPVLLRITADLFLTRQQHTSDEMAQFQEIALHLIDSIDASLLLPTARKLAQHSGTPMPVLQALLKKGGDVAASIFEFALHLDRSLLLDTARWGQMPLAIAIARRPIFDDALTRALCERPEEEIVVTLLENRSTSLDNSAVAHVLRRARKNPFLAQALAARGDLVIDMAPLFLWAPAAARSEIILAARRMDLGDFSRSRPTATEVAGHLHLERLALARQTPEFEEALAQQLGCTPETADMLMQDESGEALAIALASLGMPSDMAARIFMMADPVIAHSSASVRRLTDLVAVLNPRTARRLASVVLGLPATIQTRHAIEENLAKPLPSRPQESGLATPRPAASDNVVPLRLSA